MSARSRALLTGLNIATVVSCGLWCASTYLVELGRAYGNAPGRGELPGAAMIGVAVTTLVCVVASRFVARPGLALGIAAAPLLAVGLGAGTLHFASAEQGAQRDAAAESRRREVRARLASLTDPYRSPDPESAWLVVDAQTGVLLHLNQSPESLSAACIGRVEDGRLLLRDDFGDLADSRSTYGEHRNAQERSVFDIYTASVEPDLDLSDCPSERYDY